MIRKKEIWTFGGSKGGVGKSLICSNVGLYLSQRGYKVLLVDADFGAANLHTYLGMAVSKYSLSDFLMSSDRTIKDVIIKSDYHNLSLITGGEDAFKVSNLRYFQLRKLTDNLHRLDYDYILVDLGAGTTSQTVDVFTEGKKLILVCMPEPSAIENTYRFIKYSFFRGFKKIIDNKQVKFYLEQILAKRQTESFFYPSDLVQRISHIDADTGQKLQEFTSSFQLKLILNMVRTSNDIRLGFAMVNACRKYFGVALDYIGFIESDDLVFKAVRTRKPLLIVEPFSSSARGIKKAGESLLGYLGT